MIIWGTVLITRRVPTSITHRCGHHFILLYFERFIYLPIVFADTPYEIFWAPPCASLYTFVHTIVYYFYDESFTACEALF